MKSSAVRERMRLRGSAEVGEEWPQVEVRLTPVVSAPLGGQDGGLAGFGRGVL